jgi:hypothetical protein
MGDSSLVVFRVVSRGIKKNAQTIVCNSTLILCFTRNKNKIIFQAIECVSGLLTTT